ncbi:MAG: DNA alkylation repair protein [Balneolia bacterium]|nr:DNA alkylation repair protein [Balneolia bacterium]
MAEPLISYYGDKIPRSMCHMVKSVWPEFKGDAFLSDATPVPESLSLMERGDFLAELLHKYMPDSYPDAITLLVKAASVEPSEVYEESPIYRFLHLPFTKYVSKYGLDHFEESMTAQYELTRLFTAEFSIRPFLERYEKQTLDRLMQWTRDPDEHVRRLVSEGTRPRLPWGSRLKRFQEDPAPVIALLEELKDDESLYVRRSVANNLNDIGKDNPEVLLDTAERWSENAIPDRQWIVRHALRSLIKQGHPRALAVLGYGAPKNIELLKSQIEPKEARKGDAVRLTFTLKNTGAKAEELLVDFCVHYVKANGQANSKVFKLKELRISAGETAELSAKVSLKKMTTRTHYPGEHKIELLVNGVVFNAGAFDLVE